MQSESFLEHQRHMDSRQEQSNAQTIFGMIKIPTVLQIQNILDGISGTILAGVFNEVYQALKREGQLKTKGYHLEHNFGHGQEHLAACLLTLNLLAFLFHTVLHLTNAQAHPQGWSN
jgi:hypothetical protein